MCSVQSSLPLIMLIRGPDAAGFGGTPTAVRESDVFCCCFAKSVYIPGHCTALKKKKKTVRKKEKLMVNG